MSYYKLLKDNTLIGVATNYDFRVFQHKHNIILSCNPNQAQYVQCGEYLYHDNWMAPVTTDKVDYETIALIQIDKEEYDILYEAVEQGNDYDIEPAYPKEDIPVIDPNTETTIDFLKTAKIAEMNSACKKAIENGVDVLLCDGNVYHFSLTTQDQLNLITLQTMVASGETMIPYHADGELCRYYSVDDISRIMGAATSHKTFHVTYFNSLKAYVASLTEMKEISCVEYGIEIPEEYQSEILKKLYAGSGEINESE